MFVLDLSTLVSSTGRYILNAVDRPSSRTDNTPSLPLHPLGSHKKKTDYQKSRFDDRGGETGYAIGPRHTDGQIFPFLKLGTLSGIDAPPLSVLRPRACFLDRTTRLRAMLRRNEKARKIFRSQTRPRLNIESILDVAACFNAVLEGTVLLGPLWTW